MLWTRKCKTLTSLLTSNSRVSPGVHRVTVRLAGHSKWANIRHRKAAVDKKRSKLFSKLSREIYVSAKAGGADPEGNPRLRDAIANAKSLSCPKDIIQSALDRAANPQGGESVEEILYEGQGPHGSLFLVEAMTSNRKRTAPALRHIFSKHGGSLGQTGSAGWAFDRIGEIRARFRHENGEEGENAKDQYVVSEEDTEELMEVVVSYLYLGTFVRASQ